MQEKTRRYKGYCVRCFVHLFPDEPVVHNYKTKESTVTSFLIAKFQDKIWICDRRIEGGCSGRRPDLFLGMGSRITIVEVDENKHDTYGCTCENRRTMEISQDLNHRYIAMIRFNPHGYVAPEQGDIPSPWTYTKHGVSTFKKKWKKAWNARLASLAETIKIKSLFGSIQHTWHISTTHT